MKKIRLFRYGLVCICLGGIVASSGRSTPHQTPAFTPWSAPVNLGPVVNSPSADSGAFLSRDGLSLYFNSNRPGGSGGYDIWVSHRNEAEAPWGPPTRLGPGINTGGNEQTPTLTPDGLSLYFASDRPGTSGGLDLYVSRRSDARDDLGWGPAVNLGTEINSASIDSCPSLFQGAGGGVILFFSSDRKARGAEDIFSSTLRKDGSFGPASLIEELSTPSRDVRPAIRSDGLEIWFDSDRPGTLGGLDLWVATRTSTAAPWSAPARLGPIVNSSASIDARPVCSFDGTELYFHSNRPGGMGGTDLYRSTRGRR